MSPSGPLGCNSLSDFLVFDFVGFFCIEVFAGMPLFWNYWLTFFPHDYTDIVGFGEEDHRSKVPFVPHCISGTCYQHDLSLDTELDHLADIVLSDFSTVNDFFPPLPCYTHWQEIAMCISHLSGGLFSPLFKNRISTLIIWNSSVREICLLSPTWVFIQSFMYISMES